MNETEYKSGFNNALNQEWMWGYSCTIDDNLPAYNFHFKDSTTPGSGYSCLNVDPYFKELFDDNDYRKGMFFWGPNAGYGEWTMLSSKFKFADVDNMLADIVMMRVAEMYLIKAEAAAHLPGKTSEAQSLLKELRDARMKPGYTAAEITATGDDLLKEIWLERRKELWGEGFALTDIIRNQQPVERKTWQHFVECTYNEHEDGSVTDKTPIVTETGDVIFADDKDEAYQSKYCVILQGHSTVKLPDGTDFVPNSKYYLFRITEPAKPESVQRPSETGYLQIIWQTEGRHKYSSMPARQIKRDASYGASLFILLLLQTKTILMKLYPMKIRTIDFGERPVVLAPMEDVTDPAFRLLCKEFGADMVYTEFVSSDALIRSVDKTMTKLNISAAERPVAIQIYGKDTDTMVEAARIVEQAHPDILDLNFGCPVKRVAGKGAGAGMLQNIPQMLEITRAVVNAVQIPVTVKTRLGWDENHKVIVELAEQLQDCGIEALTIHGRTRAQMYTGEADWTLIGEVKNNPRMRIPRPLRCGCHYDRPCQFRTPVDIQGSEALSGNGRRTSSTFFPLEAGRITP